jgi:hypothetical protein
MMHYLKGNKSACGVGTAGQSALAKEDVTCGLCKRLMPDISQPTKKSFDELLNDIEYPATILDAAIKWHCSISTAKGRLMRAVYSELLDQNGKYLERREE